LRGQWTLHKNENRINLLWQNCGHLGNSLHENLDYKLEFYENMSKSEDPYLFQRRFDILNCRRS
jgi:hypothetical protein